MAHTDAWTSKLYKHTWKPPRNPTITIPSCHGVTFSATKENLVLIMPLTAVSCPMLLQGTVGFGWHAAAHPSATMVTHVHDNTWHS